jgi:hypothetical protein
MDVLRRRTPGGCEARELAEENGDGEGRRGWLGRRSSNRTFSSARDDAHAHAHTRRSSLSDVMASRKTSGAGIRTDAGYVLDLDGGWYDTRRTTKLVRHLRLQQLQVSLRSRQRSGKGKGKGLRRRTCLGATTVNRRGCSRAAWLILLLVLLLSTLELVSVGGDVSSGPAHAAYEHHDMKRTEQASNTTHQ